MATSNLSCTDGIQWLWVVFDQCLLGVAQMSGYFCGALSLMLWTIGYLMACSQIQPASRMWNLLIFTFVVNVLSFAAAIMSFQIIFVIWFDMLTTLILLLAMTAALLAMSELVPPCHRHRQLDTGQGEVPTSVPQRNHLGVASSRVCCLLLCLAIISMFMTVFIALATTDVLSEPMPSRPKSVDYTDPVMLSIVGYLLGCLACVGRWWIEVSFVSGHDTEMGENRVWTGGGVLLVMSHVLYIVGVLLHAGSLRVAIATLPWLGGRALQCCYQCSKHVLWLVYQLRQHEKIRDTKTKNKSGKDSERDNLLVASSSESGSSDDEIIFDRTLDGPENGTVPGHGNERDATRVWKSTTLQVTPLDRATTSDSETTDVTSGQELMWNDNVASTDFTHNSLLRHQRLSLASRIETLSQSSSETSDQRVRSWISQSTPEEETPPCLTLTLNLDTVSKSTSNMTDDNFCQNRKCNFARTLPIRLRKNSF